jgi:hypothetical protein
VGGRAGQAVGIQEKQKGKTMKKLYYWIVPITFVVAIGLVFWNFVSKSDFANNSIIKFFISN